MGTIDIVFAGFLCQGFSHAGKKRTDDSRNELFFEFVRVTKIIQPRVIIGENVAGLLQRKTPRGENVIDIIQEHFGNIGYFIIYKVLDATDFGIPQKRKRLFIIGSREQLTDQVFQLPQQPTTSIRSVIEPTLDEAIPIEFKHQVEPKFYKVLDESVDHKPTGKPHPNLLRLVSGIRGLTSEERLEQLTL